MTARQIVNVDVLKAASAEFTTMRIWRCASEATSWRTGERLDTWLNDAGKCGVYGMRRFVRTLRQDIEAVRNACLNPGAMGRRKDRSIS